MTISLSIPGDAAHMSVLRATAASVAARARLTIDQLEDVRLAVEEAATTLLAGSPAAIEVSMDPTNLPLTVTVSASPTGPVDLDPKGFSWTILSAMTDEFEVDASGGSVTLTMRFASLTPST
ncbi:ATP-binding protein [Euzebya sp.]|uniref:ATP-binding protein n=1 Tax=Euzebya sp. TaxID=1971409 RepID=UPI00351302B4